MAEEFLKVVKIQVLTLSNPEEQDTGLGSMPFLRFELEDGSYFIMAGIPPDIALNISRYLYNIPVPDSRLQLHDLINEIAIVEKVEIDSLVPTKDVYQATIYIQLEGFKKTLTYQMVPSHATLLAVSSNAPIYVAKSLIVSSMSEGKGGSSW